MISDKCLICGGVTQPLVEKGKIVNVTIEGTSHKIPPMNLFVCVTCGHWQIFSLMFRQKPVEEIPISEAPEGLKKEFGIK